VAPLVALSLIALVGVVAIVLDGGLLLMDRRQCQRAADGAALAAAAQLYTDYPAQYPNPGLDPKGTAKASALAYAAANGYSNDGTSSVVTVNIPPTSGDHAGQAGYAEVIVQYNQPRGFSGLFGSAPVPVRARTVARGLQTPYSNAGILLLNKNAAGSYNDSGHGTTVTQGSPVIIDSNSLLAAILAGQAQLSASETDITGGVSLGGQSSILGTLKTGVAPTADPLASLPVPDPSTMPVQSNALLSIAGGSPTLSPGVYNGGINIATQGTVTLQPGVYYLNGGGLVISAQSAVTGQGVMIYNNPLVSTDQINITGGSAITLSPPTSGVYMGLTLFQNRTSTVPLYVAGNTNTNLSGTFYAAGARFNISGTSSFTMGSQFIADSMTISGGATFTVNWYAGSVARKHIIGLVE
jgi:hypothetical protein